MTTRTHSSRRGAIRRHKGLTEADYARLLDADHQQLDGASFVRHRSNLSLADRPWQNRANASVRLPDQSGPACAPIDSWPRHRPTGHAPTGTALSTSTDARRR